MKPDAKILIVDDEPAVIQLLSKTLSDMEELRYATASRWARRCSNAPIRPCMPPRPGDGIGFV